MTTKLLTLKIKISYLSALKVFQRPSYALLALFGTFISSEFILWSLNLDLVRYILFEAPIDFLQKISFFLVIYKNLYTTYSSAQGVGIAIFSILFGINLAVLVFVFKHKGFQAIPKKSGIGGFVFAILGGGCIACGTSLIAPLIATFGATAAPFVIDLATSFDFIGSLLIMYSLYKLGGVCSYIFALRDQDNPHQTIKRLAV